MTDDERKEAIESHVAIYLAERNQAEEGLAKIKAGWTFHEGNGRRGLKDVTEQHADRFRKTIERMDSVLATYRRWNE